MIHIKITTSDKDFVSVREYKKAMVEVHDAMGKKWHADMLPRHFHRGARQQYGHKPRSKGYIEKKRRMAARRQQIRGVDGQGGYVQRGGEVDNVFSGNLEKMLKRVSTIRAFPSRVTVNMTGPRYVTMRAFQGNRSEAVAKGWKYGKGKAISLTAGQQPDKIKELTATTEQERRELAEIADKTLQRAAAGW